MDLHRLAVFVKVYECRSLSRSAEAVFLSQPTISGHLARLEEELGVKLFDRLGRGVAPTPAGEALYGYARRLLALRDEALEAVAAVSGRIQGRLQVGASTIPGNYLLPGRLAEMRRLYPDLKVTLLLGDTTGIVHRVEEGEVELGVVGAKVEARRVNFTPCGRDLMVLAAPAGHPLTGRGEVAAAALTGHPFLLREPGSGTRLATAKALGELGLKLADLNAVAELGSTEAVRQGLLSGLGMSIISRVAVEPDLAAGRLAEVAVQGLKLERSFYLAVRAGRSISPGGQGLISLLGKEGSDA